MKSKLLVPAILFCVVAGLSIYLLINQKHTTTVSNPENTALNNSNNEVNGIVLFYGDGCPHCALVEQYISENNIESKVQFTKKEVYNNQQNASELTAKAKACGMATDSIGVPFLWDGSSCLVGDQPIIDFFKQKAGK